VPAATETLHAKKREVRGSRACRRLRAEGLVPAILYGRKEEPEPLQIPYEELEEPLRRHSRILELHVGRKKESVLVKDVQYDAFGSEIVHVDFVRVAMDEMVTLEVPIVLKGATKQEHAVLQQALDAVEVECLPGDIPESFVAMVGHLQVGEIVRVAQLDVPKGVRILTDPETIVATLTLAMKEEAVAAPAEAEVAAVEPELIGREKKEEEELPEEEEKKEKRPKTEESQ
jgi:large subunit ribosomal protein L25